MVRAPGNVHLLVVRQGPPGYELGEIAHIENVLKGETKERLHRRATTREEVVTRETERQEESEQDHQSTERFELQHETAKTIQEESEAHGDVSISASYGPTVSVSADAGFATSYAKEESENRSSQYAREVTDRSVSRVQERVREQRVVRVVKEIEETNRHHIANTEQGADHVVGIYRWVDKVYEAQLVEYDLRLMVEFHIPEPAAFYLHAAAAQVPEGITISRPDPPMLPNGQPLTPMELDWVNYLDWAQRYQVAGLSPPPAATHTATLAWEEPVQEWPPSTASLKPIFKATKTLTIPDGYEAYNLKAAVLKRGGVSNPGVFAVNGEQIDLHSGWPVTFSMELPHVRQPLALAISLHESYGFAASIAVDCVLSTDAFEKWQIATYEAIMRAYFEWKSTYEEQVAAATTSRGIAITGRNPQENRAIERTELKKETLSILTGQRFASFDAIGTTAPYD